jgi:hypothetical protein
MRLLSKEKEKDLLSSKVGKIKEYPSVGLHSP